MVEDQRNSHISLLMLVLAFSALYITVELLLIANRGIFGPDRLANTVELLLISFLNITPAGIFAFTVVSVLPRHMVSKKSDDALMARAVSNLEVLRVAELYTTFNDFMPDYALYNLTEARRRGRGFFILDDSTNSSNRKGVDSFAQEYQCQVLRRNHRKGYKAGAINAWLHQYSTEYDYVFILDSDSQASHSAIDYCVELARRDPNIAVIQSKTMTMTSSPSRFTKSGVTIQHAYMAVIQAGMKNLGTTPFYGHNALLKVSALAEVGGLVEESNEDYKTLARLHNKGFDSLYAAGALTYEEIPPDYFSSRKRALRWARDAVGQLGLLRYKLPLAMVFYLIYGWETYMANIVLLALLILLAYNGFLPIGSGGTTYFAEMAGVTTMSVLILWPLVAVRVKDSELTIRSVLVSVAWGTLFNAPMMGAVSAQIIKTTCAQLYAKITKSFGQTNTKLVEEFIVTPKFKNTRNQTFRSVLGMLKAEFALGSVPVIVAIAVGAVWFLVFSSIQLLMLVTLPVAILAESKCLRGAREDREGIFSRYTIPMVKPNHERSDPTPLVGNIPVALQSQQYLTLVRTRIS